ncbi:MAG TPA: energy-coupling factor transporter transmembrane component T [Syntrophales bacterium]|nr:energy-coupling factor transporter transmembrane component T [Syntrophales bacterium]
MKYLDKETFLHRLDPRSKIVMGLMGAILIVVLKTPIALFLLFLTVLTIFALLRPARRTCRTIIVLMATAFCFTMISQGFFYALEPRTAIMTFLTPESGMMGSITGGIALYREGIIYGALQSLRLCSAMLLSAAIVMSTYPADLLLGMGSLGVPERIGFVVTVSIRFLPVLLDEAQRILLAQKLRGLNTKGVRGGFRAFRYLLPPLIIDSLRNARRTALAAEVRAFTGKRTTVRELRFAVRDWVTLGFSGAGMIMLILYQAVSP